MSNDDGKPASTSFLEGLGNFVTNLISSSDSGDAPVAIPWDTVNTSPSTNGAGLSEHSQGVPKPTVLSGDGVQAKLYSYFADPNKRQDFATDLVKIGALGDSRGFTQVGYFTSAAGRAIDMYQASGSPLPFTQWLATTAAASKIPVKPGGGGSGSGSGGGGGGSAAYNGPTSSVTFTNEFDAKAILNNALGSYLGRQATDGELEAFKKQLTSTEAANPLIDSPTGAHSAARVGGVNQEQVAKEFAMSRDNYAETQATTTLTGWLTDSVLKGKQERIV